MRNKTCCFTGHRDISSNEVRKIKKHLEKEIENLINQGVIYMGQEELWALILLQQK